MMMIKLSVKERREQFLFLIGIFFFSTILFSIVLFHDFGAERTVSSAELTEKLQQDKDFESTVREQRATVDTTYKQIIRFDPGVQAVFLENDIRNELASIKSAYQRRASDQRYKTFLQASQLYSSMFYNRRELKGNSKDLERLSKSLEDCKLSTTQLRQSIGNQNR
ncbi:type VI secretion system transmembrane protein TssO [Pedobacter sp. MC2016-15]|uniref:type VI secretion system transmembrane protein TssO n=1 Tax=Pedobacter sp. MC2016-15 TaxID=2994473 RepID=UPI00224603E2|nr:type VI secretion system transmembrane protein TssO [Pedobacter sp. MC2016-15]MCX2478061.1 type VI secretion system transmembrane protein TssO [Pedobacter sp. MC2016-15]